MSNRPILVTGGAGFLGCHLVKRLLSDGQHVVVIDNFFTGRRSNLADVASYPNLKIIEADVVDPAPASLDVGQIYHLACPASPVHYQKDPLYTYRTSVWGAWNMLLLAERCQARIMFASTSEVYGDPDIHPQVESYWGNVNPIGIRSCYDEGKRGAETLASDFVRAKRAEVRIARIFNTYGPNMSADDGRVVSNFIAQAIRGQAMTVYGDGEQTRSFCFVSDLVEGFVRLMAYEGDDAHKPFNLGNPDEFTIKELVDELSMIVREELAKKYLPLPSDDPSRRRPNIDRARSKLGWEPTIKLREGLRTTYDWFLAEMAAK